MCQSFDEECSALIAVNREGCCTHEAEYVPNIIGGELVSCARRTAHFEPCINPEDSPSFPPSVPAALGPYANSLSLISPRARCSERSRETSPIYGRARRAPISRCGLFAVLSFFYLLLFLPLVASIFETRKLPLLFRVPIYQNIFKGWKFTNILLNNVVGTGKAIAVVSLIDILGDWVIESTFIIIELLWYGAR